MAETRIEERKARNKQYMYIESPKGKRLFFCTGIYTRREASIEIDTGKFGLEDVN
jgi:hypothetical protein